MAQHQDPSKGRRGGTEDSERDKTRETNKGIRSRQRNQTSCPMLETMRTPHSVPRHTHLRSDRPTDHTHQPLLAGQRFASYEAVGGWQSGVEEVLRPQISKVAAALRKHPDGRKVKAPPRLVKKESTRDLLAENILGMQPSDRSMAGRSR